MATTQNTFTGDGSNLGPFSFTFKWLESTDIKVTVAGVLKTAGTHYNLQGLNYTTKTGGQVLFTAGNAPANGAAIVVYRQTDDSDLAATFYSGSAIRAQDLNNNFIQGLYVTQESNNVAASATSTANTALTNSNTAISTANGAVSTANTASTNASAAVATANTANTNASAAVSTANTANSNASAAVSTANTAASNASTALSTANTALSTANTADTNASTAISTANTALSTANTAASNASAAVSTANTASSNASTALSTANTAISTANAAASAVANAILYDIVANVAAIPASPANNDAVEVTDSTGIQSFTPLTGVPAGFVGSSGLSVRLVYTTTGSTWNWIQYFPNDPETRYLKLAGGTLTGDLTVSNQGDIRFGEATANGSNYVAIQAPSSLAANVTYTLPSADGTGGQVLSTNGSGTLSWATASGGSSVTTSDTPPATPNDGDLWYDSVGGRTYVYYQDPNGSQWVDAAPQGGGSSTSITTGNTTAEVIDTGSDGRFVVTTEGSERLRINSSGQVALGGATPVTELTMPLTFGSAGEVNKLALYGSNFGFGISTGAVNYISTENHVFYNGASAPKVERARIDSSGRLLVGTSTSTDSAFLIVQGNTVSSASGAAINIATGTATPADGGSLGVIRFSDSGHSEAVSITGRRDGGTWSASSKPSRLTFSTTADGASSPTERMRITSGGKLLFQTTSPLQGEDQVEFRVPFDASGGKGGVGFYNSNTTTSSDGAPPIIVYKGSTTTGTTARFIQFYAGGTATPMGGIVGNGSNNVQFASISDIRDKKNVEPLSGSLEKVKQLEVVSYDWIANDEHVAAGFIAQNVETVFPEYVVENMSNGSQEARKGITGGLSSGYVAVLTAALQEAVARIEAQDTTIASLEARLTALEGGTN